MTLSRVFAAARFLFAAVTLTAVGIQLGIHIDHGFSVLNFFSYFTNLSNIFAAVVLLVESILSWRGKSLGAAGSLVRGISVVCMALVGIVYVALLRDVDLGSLLPWINTWLHYIMPVVIVADWLIQSPRQSVALQKLWITLLFPLAYLAYSLLRGAVINWYAYPFLNPATGGYGPVALTCVVVAVVFVVASAVLFWLANTLRPLVPTVSSPGVRRAPR